MSASLVALAFATLATSSAVAPAASEPPPPTRPYVALAGPHTAVDGRWFAVVRTQEAFAALWSRHLGDRVERAAQGWPLPPRVDFDRCTVFAVFSGDRTNCNGEMVEAIDDLGDRTRVRFDSMTFQTASFDGEDPGVPSRPYGIFVIPRTDEPIVVEENTQALIGHPPVWTERAVIVPDGSGAVWVER